MRPLSPLLAIVLAASLPVGAPAKSAGHVLKPLEDAQYTLKRSLDPGKVEDDDPEEAYDISGIACRPPETGKALHCLVVNDEDRLAQAIKIKDRRIKPDPAIKLITKKTVGETLGDAPANKDCEGSDKEAKAADEFDAEGVAYADDHYYVVGSHGCGRKQGRFKLSALRLARIPLDEHGEPDEDGIVTTYRLADALAKAPAVGDKFLKPLDKNGLNVEGVAVVGDTLFAGLRAPSLDGKAYLVGVSLKALFAKRAGALTETPTVIPLDVGPNAGIRDLSALDDGRLLVLTGPAQEQPEVDYSLLIAELPSGKTRPLGSLAPLKGHERGGKAEAITVVGRNRVLVLFDSLANGGPREYEVDETLQRTP